MSFAVANIQNVRDTAGADAAKLPESDPLRAQLQSLSTKADELRSKIVATKEGGMITGEERIREHVGELYGDDQPVRRPSDRLPGGARGLARLTSLRMSSTTSPSSPLRNCPRSIRDCRSSTCRRSRCSMRRSGSTSTAPRRPRDRRALPARCRRWTEEVLNARRNYLPGLKLERFGDGCGTAEAVPFQTRRLYEM